MGLSVSEMLRRAGFPEGKPAGGGLSMKGARAHLEESQTRARKKPVHRIPPELVTKLAAVLPISEAELLRAAELAAGYAVPLRPKHPDFVGMLARYLGDKEVTEEDKLEVESALLRVLADRGWAAREQDKVDC